MITPARISKLKSIGLHYAQLAAVETGLVPGHESYTRFIILGQGRTGSNFLYLETPDHDSKIQ